jgi:hypothetical protein
VAEQLGPPDRPGFPGENEKRGLKGVFRILVGEKSTANAEHHWAVPLDECGEGVFIPSFDEAVQKLSIGLVGQAVKKSDDRGKAIGHQSLSRGP